MTSSPRSGALELICLGLGLALVACGEPRIMRSAAHSRGELGSTSSALITVADYYFDAESGSNSNDGLTPGTAKKDLDGLAALGSAINGKTIAFRDGLFYRRTGSSSAAISIPSNLSNVRLTNWDGDASTALPRITAAKQVSNWTSAGGNVWQATADANGTLIFSFPDAMHWGIERGSQAALTQEFDFYQSGGTVYCYAPSDPDSRYETVESPTHNYNLDIYGDSITVDHLDIRYGLAGGVVLNYGGEGNVIRDNRVLYIGDSAGMLAGTGGEGIFINASHTQVLRNVVRETSHHVIFMYIFSGQTVTDVLVEGNRLSNGHYNFFDMNTSGGTLSDVVIRYNIASEDPTAEYRDEPNYNGRNGGFWTNGGVQNALIAYNLMYDLYDAVLFDCRVGAITVHNNTFVQSRPGTTQNVVYTGGGAGSVFKNNILLAASGGSVGTLPAGSSNNLTSDPSFADFASADFAKRDFRLKSTSAAIDAGLDLGYSRDLVGAALSGAPDIGAYEFVVQCTDGQTQACYTGPTGTSGVGPCHGGTRTCAGGTFGACVGEVVPAEESCADAIDNDCDGAVNEDWPELGSACAAGLGACLAQGTMVCASSGLATECDAVPGAPAASEACDGTIDDDCDGAVDNGCPCTIGAQRACYNGPSGTAGVGVCADGQQSCAAGTWGACDGATLPSDELCTDTLDNDCDGLVDSADAANCGGPPGAPPPSGAPPSASDPTVPSGPADPSAPADPNAPGGPPTPIVGAGCSAAPNGTGPWGGTLLAFALLLLARLVNSRSRSRGARP